MYALNEAYAHYKMIEDGILITKDQVLEEFLLNEKDLYKAVRSGNIAMPILRYDEEYHHREEIELWVFNRRRKQAAGKD